MSADILRIMQEVIRNKDVSKDDFPISIGFSSSGKVIVRHSLDSTPFSFDTVDMALEHIKKYIGDDAVDLLNNVENKKMVDNCCLGSDSDDINKNKESAKEQRHKKIEKIERVFWYSVIRFIWVFVYLMAVSGLIVYIQKNMGIL